MMTTTPCAFAMMMMLIMMMKMMRDCFRVIFGIYVNAKEEIDIFKRSMQMLNNEKGNKML